MAQQITDYKSCRLGMSWGSPFEDGYGKSPTDHVELMAMLSGKVRGRYQDRGYTYLDFDGSKTEGSKVVYSLVDSGQSRNKEGSEWETMEHRMGEFEVVALETEDMKAATVRMDQGSKLTDDPTTRITVETGGQVTVGIWNLEWQRDEAGNLISLVATTDTKDFRRRSGTG
jgi:hypothetical protein